MSRRILAAASVSAVLLTGLVGCSSAGSASGDDCTAALQPGVLSDGVELQGTVGGTPEVKIGGRTDIVNAQRSVIRHGEGAGVIRGGEVVTANVTIFDGESGESIAPTQKRFLQALPQDIQPDFTEYLASGESDRLVYTDLLMAGLVCSAPGDVLAVAITPGQAQSSQIGADATVMVVEVLDAHGSAASGASLALPWGFPALTEDETGRPGLVLPPQAAPSEQRVATAIAGSGAEVTADDYMIGHVLTVGWNDRKVRENTWESNLVELGSESQPAAYAFRPALTGYTVGSRVVILDPNGGDPVVHVVDIIAVG